MVWTGYSSGSRWTRFLLPMTALGASEIKIAACTRCARSELTESDRDQVATKPSNLIS
jgi:hypothetical protein